MRLRVERMCCHRDGTWYCVRTAGFWSSYQTLLRAHCREAAATANTPPCSSSNPSDRSASARPCQCSPRPITLWERTLLPNARANASLPLPPRVDLDRTSIHSLRVPTTLHLSSPFLPIVAPFTLAVSRPALFFLTWSQHAKPHSSVTY